MSTRCHIEIFDYFDSERPGALLYHHADGYPSFMMGKLQRFLAKVTRMHCDWNAEDIAAAFIMLSIEDYWEPLLPFSTNKCNHSSVNDPRPSRPNRGLPVFSPCVQYHPDIELVWRVYLQEDHGNYVIRCFFSCGEEIDLSKVKDEYQPTVSASGGCNVAKRKSTKSQISQAAINRKKGGTNGQN